MNKRILYAASTIGHINDFHLEIIDKLRLTGAHVFVMARGEGADFDIPFEKRLLSWKNLKCLFLIRKILKKEEFHAVVLNTSLAAFLVRVAMPKRLKKTTKVVNFVHGYLFHASSRFFRRVLFLLCEKLVARKTDVVITMNSYDYDMARRHKLSMGDVILSRGVGVRHRRVITPPEKIRREIFGVGRRVIAFVGELSVRKNQEFLIRCLPLIRRSLCDVRLCLVGDGAERQGLEALAGRLSLGDEVIFTGYRKDAMDFIRACDVYVTASHSEGLPINLIEAMSLGKTVVASAIKGHTDLIRDGVSGYLCDVGDEEGFSDTVCRALGGALLPPERVREAVHCYDRESAAIDITDILLGKIGVSDVGDY